MEEERRQLHKAVEKEHDFIVAEKARLKIDKRLGTRENHKSMKMSSSNIHDVSIINLKWHVWYAHYHAGPPLAQTISRICLDEFSGVN